MTDKDLKEKAIDIKGKSYILVKDRVVAFNESYPNGRIETSLLSYDGGRVTTKAVVTPDVTKPERFFTGHASELESSSMINKTSAIENCETSAVGRALALMGIGVIDSIASVDEVRKAENAVQAQPTQRTEHYCSIHNKPMKERTSKSGGHWYDHRWQDETGEWQQCNGKSKEDHLGDDIAEDAINAGL